MTHKKYSHKFLTNIVILIFTQKYLNVAISFGSQHNIQFLVQESVFQCHQWRLRSSKYEIPQTSIVKPLSEISDISVLVRNL